MFTIQDGGPKEKKSDRVLVLKPIEGKETLTNKGLVDKRLFSGGNNLHAIRDQQTTLWNFKYESGVLPDELRQKFTSFTKLKAHADEYFEKRNIEITEVLD